MDVATIPEHWLVKKFTDVLDIQGGTQPPKSEFKNEPEDGYVRLLQIRDFGKKPVPTFIPDTKKIKKCTEEDLLIGRYGASLGRICTGMSGAYNVALAKVINSGFLCNGFLKAYLESDIFQTPLALLSRSAQNGFNKEDLATFNFPLPPLAEQKEIADRLDKLLAQVEATQARLARIPDIIKQFRQSVLAAAVSGKLTEEWRSINENTPWLEGVLGDFIHKPTYGSSTKSDNDGLVPVLRMGNLQNGHLDWTDLVYTSDKVEIEKYKLTTGDVLFNRTNSPELVGKTSIYRGERAAIYAGYLIKISCLPILNPEFLNYHLNSPSARAYCYAVKSDGVSQSNINAKKLAEYPIALPQQAEQTEIVRRVEQLFAYADSIEQQAKAAKARVDNLTQAILAKAFRGELTADWRAANPDLISGDNSAEALLARIQAERAQSAKKGRKRTQPAT